MSQDISLLALSGSTRAASHNKILVKTAARAAERAGARVMFVELGAFALPLYDADAEQIHGLPAPVVTLKALCEAADGYLVSAPEYNGSLPAVLKNAIDWIDRKSVV